MIKQEEMTIRGNVEPKTSSEVAETAYNREKKPMCMTEVICHPASLHYYLRQQATETSKSFISICACHQTGPTTVSIHPAFKTHCTSMSHPDQTQEAINSVF